MRTLLFILKKEFTQIFRNRTMLPIIFIMPLLQMLVLVYAASLEMKNIDMVVVDNDLSGSSRKLMAKFTSSPFYRVQGTLFSLAEAENLVKQDKADIILVIPRGFEKDLYRKQHSSVQLLVNAINQMTAALSYGYSSAVISQFSRNVMAENINYIQPVNIQSINIETSYWYNPRLNYRIYMLPGIIVILVTIVGMFLSAFNLVREKELGTIEQINVTPVRKYQFIAGKLIPFWLIALFELAFGLTLGKLIFDIPILGSIPLLFGFASVYLLAVMGLGLFISAISNTQQQVMFSAFFFMLVFIMMSGIFTPVESMPLWAQKVNYINPYYYFMRVIRMILLKGSGFRDIITEFACLSAYAVIVLSLAVWRYRKTT